MTLRVQRSLFLEFISSEITGVREREGVRVRVCVCERQNMCLEIFYVWSFWSFWSFSPSLHFMSYRHLSWLNHAPFYLTDHAILQIYFYTHYYDPENTLTHTQTQHTLEKRV